MPKLFTLLTCFFTLQMMNAQQIQWAKFTASTGNFQINYTDFLADGTTIHAGYFSGTADFDSGEGQQLLTATGNTDAFLLKLDANGNFQWVHSIGGSTGFESIAGVEVDQNYDIICVGHFEGSANFPGQGLKVSQGFEDMFVMKFSQTGSIQWFKTIANPVSNVASSFIVDDLNHILITGYFANTLDFDPSEGVSEKTSAGSWDIYVLRLTNDGDFVWCQTIGSSDLDQPFQICGTTDGGVAVTFRLNSESIWDFCPANMPVAESLALGVIKLDVSGSFEWMNQISNTYASQLHSRSLLSDSQGNIYHAGVFTGTRDFDDTESLVALSSVTGYYDCYISKTSSTGDFIYAKQLGGLEEDMLQSFCIDQLDQLHITGSFTSSTIDIAPDAQVTETLTKNGSQDLFVLSLDMDGQYLNHQHLSGSGTLRGLAIDCNQLDEIILSLALTGDMSITADGETINYSQAIGFGSLLTNSKYCVPTTGETDVLACGNYTSPSGAYIWTESGDFVDVVQTSSGCDSTVVVHLTIQEIEAAILQDDEALMATYDNAEYKWIDCGNNFSFIPGADEQFFTPSISGTYAVQVTVNGCSETSECIDYTVASTSEHIVLDKWHVYPNPNNGTFTIPKTAIREAYEIRIVDAYGQLVQRQRAISNSNIEVQFSAPAGIYHVQLIDKNNVRSTQIVKY